ncbi:MAG: BamA/TamA family outer membrane protein [Chlamydiales bacterium]|nr:BamA/TamA family outer membrane protein [Chlamydiales bacterium]
MKRALTLFFTLLLALPLLLNAAELSYSVEFEGLYDSDALRSVKEVSQLIALKKHRPSSLGALRYRADADVADIVKVLHGRGYYEAAVTVRMEEVMDEMRVTMIIKPGPIYTIGSYEVRLYCRVPEACVQCTQISPEVLEMTPGKSAEAPKILQAELKILELLADCGYPLASIVEREMVADGEKKSVEILVKVDTGPLTHFGLPSLSGQRRVRPEFIEKKILWKQGDLYQDTKVERTQSALLDTGLFSAVMITHEDALNEAGELPMRIDVTENKHRSVHVGISYQTVFGPGGTFGWEHRNINGLGRKLSIHGEVTRISHSGMATYNIPDFHNPHQEFVGQAQAMHESITAYSERSYNLLGRIERKFGERFRASIGLKGEELIVRDSVENGNFPLFELPLYFRWSSADDLLDPTSGATWQYIATPTVNVRRSAKFYLYEEMIQSVYLPLTKNRKVVLAQKVTLGSIFSGGLDDVPVPKRFLGGSEEDLRGYKYLTVSPLFHHHKPIGGRSAVYYTLETRFRVSKSIGLVPFFDAGNVYRTMLPTFRGKWRKSVGLGVRIFSFIGPLRFDVGVPLNRRKGLDSKYRLFVSIGQMF